MNIGAGTMVFLVGIAGILRADVSLGLGQSAARRSVKLTAPDSTGATATALSLSGPTQGSPGTPSTPFTLRVDGRLSRPVTVNPSDHGGGGTFSPSSLTLSDGAQSATFRYTPVSLGAKILGCSNTGGLINPPAWTYAVINLGGPDAGAWSPARDGEGNVLASEFQALPLKTWVSVAGERNDLSDVREPEKYPNGWGNDGFVGVVDGWGGAGWNFERLEMLISGGGHGSSSAAETGVYAVSGRTLRTERVVDRQPLSSALNWDGTRLIPGEGFPSGHNFPLATGVPGSKHTYEGLLWIPPSEMLALGIPAPRRGGLFYPGNAKGVINLDTGAYTKMHWFNVYTSHWATSYISAVRWNHRLIFPYNSFTIRRWDMSLTEMTDWQTSGYDPTPSVPSFGAWLANRSSSIEFVYNHRVFCDMPERGEMVSFAGNQAAVRVRYGAAEDANASSWTSYHEPITLIGSGAADFTSANLQDLGNNLLSQGGAHYLHSAGEIWVCPNTAGNPLYRVTWIGGSTWTVDKMTGTELLTSSGQATYGRFVVFTTAGVKIGMRISSATNPIEVVRLP